MGVGVSITPYPLIVVVVVADLEFFA